MALIASLIELKSLWQPSQSSQEVSSARTSPALYAEKFTFGLPGAIAIGSDAIQLYDRPTSGQTNGFKLLISCFKKEKKRGGKNNSEDSARRPTPNSPFSALPTHAALAKFSFDFSEFNLWIRAIRSSSARLSSMLAKRNEIERRRR